MNDKPSIPFGTLNGSVNWNSGPGPVVAFLQQYSTNQIGVLNVVSDWEGVKLQVGMNDPSTGLSFNLGIKTDFYSTCDGADGDRLAGWRRRPNSPIPPR